MHKIKLCSSFKTIILLFFILLWYPFSVCFYKKFSRTPCLLSNIEKIIEKLIFRRVLNFLDINNLIYSLQFGFQQKHSTTHAMSNLTFVLIGIHSLQGWTATIRYGATIKRSTKRLKHTRNLFRKNRLLWGAC